MDMITELFPIENRVPKKGPAISRTFLFFIISFALKHEDTKDVAMKNADLLSN